MGRLTVFLGLLTLLEASIYQAIPPWVYKEVTEAANGEAVTVTDWSWTSVGNGAFSFSSWIKTLPSSGANDAIYFMQIKNSGGTDLTVQWPRSDSNTAVVADGGYAMVDVGLSRADNVWFHISGGIYSGRAFVVLSLRRLTNFQFSADDTNSFVLDSNPVLKAPAAIGETFSGIYTDTVIRVGESFGMAQAQAYIFQTFLCGASSVTCVGCHPSCTACAVSGVCDACAGTGAVSNADNSACVCGGATGGSGLTHATCTPCDPSCASCWLGGSASGCTSCPGSLSPSLKSGTCCGLGNALQANIGDTCVPCTGCTKYCDSTDTSLCFDTPDQVLFHKIVSADFGLPLNSETTDNHMCYRQMRPMVVPTGCAADFITAVTGAISNYNTVGSAAPSDANCAKLLISEWPWIIHHFNTVFTGFTGPSTATPAEKLRIKSILYLWIFQFGPSEMKRSGWGDLITAMKNTGTWSGFFGWVTTADSLDAGFVTNGNPANRKVFPSDLLDWLNSSDGCNGVTAGCKDLQVFNLKSTVCGSASCGFSASCASVFGTTACSP